MSEIVSTLCRVPHSCAMFVHEWDISRVPRLIDEPCRAFPDPPYNVLRRIASPGRHSQWRNATTENASARSIVRHPPAPGRDAPHAPRPPPAQSIPASASPSPPSAPPSPSRSAPPPAPPPPAEPSPPSHPPPSPASPRICCHPVAERRDLLYNPQPATCNSPTRPRIPRRDPCLARSRNPRRRNEHHLRPPPALN